MLAAMKLMIKVKTFDVAIDIWTMLVQWIQNTLTKNLNKIRGSLENMTRQFMQKIFKKYKMENMTAGECTLFNYQTLKKFVMTWEKVIEEVERYLSEIWEEMLSICFNQIDAIIEEEEEERRGYIANP
jgi:chemotaxis protein histidine kinase CheA